MSSQNTKPIKLTLHSKRSRSESSKQNHLSPPRKKARYTYNPQFIDQRASSPSHSHSHSHSHCHESSPQSPRILPRMSDNETSVSDAEPIKPSLRGHTVLLRSTTDAIDSDTVSPFEPKKRIPNTAIAVRTAESAWCPLEWFSDRIRTDAAEGDSVFDILPFEEAEGIAQQLIMYQGGSVTLNHNLISILDTMRRITDHIQSLHDTAERQKSGGKGPYSCSGGSSVGGVSKTQRVKWLRDQNESLQGFDADSLYAQSEANKLKMQQSLDRYHKEKREYKAAECQRQKQWDLTPPPPPKPEDMGNYESFLSDLEMNQNINSLQRDVSPNNPGPVGVGLSSLSMANSMNLVAADIDDTDFMSSADRESDEDFCIEHDDGDSNNLFSHKKRRNKKRKKRKPHSNSNALTSTTTTRRSTASKEPLKSADALYLEGKNPVFSTADPTRFWSKFKGFIEPIHPQELRTLFPHLQADAYPVRIPPLPISNDVVKSTTDLILDGAPPAVSIHSEDTSNPNPNPNNNSNHQHDLVMTHVAEQDRCLYFGEMPTLYESFRPEKSYLEEQRAIEDSKNTLHLKSDALHQLFPIKSSMGHSFDQRSLSCIVSGAGGEMWNFERDNVDANHWDKIGIKRKENIKNKSKGKMNGNHVNGSSDTVNGHKGSNIENGGSDRGKMEGDKDEKGNDGDGDSDDDGDDMIEPIIRYKPIDEMESGPISFEQSIRNQICKHFFHSDWSQLKEIESMPWQERQDDECCAVIKSLQDAMQQKCYEDAPNDIETNVEIANEIIGIAENQMDRHLDDFETLRQFDEYLSVIRKQNISSGLRVNMELLQDPQWKQYFEQKLDLNVEQAINVVVKHPHVQTVQK